ncbi:MAG: hypothetical protein AAB019_04770 [Planctomycetota bacterium]
MRLKKYLILLALLAYLLPAVGLLVHSLEREQYSDCLGCHNEEVKRDIPGLVQPCCPEQPSNNSNHSHHNHPVHQVHNCLICHNGLLFSVMGGSPAISISQNTGPKSTITTSELCHFNIFTLTKSIRSPPSL